MNTFIKKLPIIIVFALLASGASADCVEVFKKLEASKAFKAKPPLDKVVMLEEVDAPCKSHYYFHYMMANALLQGQEYEKANDYGHKGLELIAQDDIAWQRDFRLLILRIEKIDKAVRLYLQGSVVSETIWKSIKKELIEIANSYGETYGLLVDLSLASKALNELKAATTYARKAFKLKQDVYSFTMLLDLLMDTEQYQEAAVLVTTGFSVPGMLNKDASINAAEKAARAHTMMGDVQGAVHYIQQLEVVEPRFMETEYNQETVARLKALLDQMQPEM